MITDTQTADLLEKAADVLEANGWARGILGAPNSEGGMSYCAYGALNMADHNSYNYDYPYGTNVFAAAKAVEQSLPPRGLVVWNNHVAADKYEVIEVFRQTAKDLRNNS